MYVVVVTPNKDGKIELTKDELQKMLDDAYAKGYSEGASKINYYPITVPSWPVTYGTRYEITCSAN